jgi:hypothetical protein
VFSNDEDEVAWGGVAFLKRRTFVGGFIAASIAPEKQRLWPSHSAVSQGIVQE